MGEKAASRALLKGTGESRAPRRATGASSHSNASWPIVAASSPPKPPVVGASCRTRTRPVFFAEAILQALGFVVAVALYSAGSIVFWRALAYLAVFHFVRQQYGWVALYRGRILVGMPMPPTRRAVRHPTGCSISATASQWS